MNNCTFHILSFIKQNDFCNILKACGIVMYSLKVTGNSIIICEYKTLFSFFHCRINYQGFIYLFLMNYFLIEKQITVTIIIQKVLGLRIFRSEICLLFFGKTLADFVKA